MYTGPTLRKPEEHILALTTFPRKAVRYTEETEEILNKAEVVTVLAR